MSSFAVFLFNVLIFVVFTYPTANISCIGTNACYENSLNCTDCTIFCSGVDACYSTNIKCDGCRIICEENSCQRMEVNITNNPTAVVIKCVGTDACEYSKLYNLNGASIICNGTGSCDQSDFYNCNGCSLIGTGSK